MPSIEDTPEKVSNVTLPYKTEDVLRRLSVEIGTIDIKKIGAKSGISELANAFCMLTGMIWELLIVLFTLNNVTSHKQSDLFVIWQVIVWKLNLWSDGN